MPFFCLHVSPHVQQRLKILDLLLSERFETVYLLLFL